MSMALRKLMAACIAGLVPGLLIILTIGALSGCAARPIPPPPGVEATLPFGAIDIDELHFELDSELQNSIARSLLDAEPRQAVVAGEKAPPYDVLILTGGGSRGAFGAGLLNGWTAAGSRPDFRIVTGVSTGALQSTFAFLGSEYDHFLKEIYTQYSTSDLYRGRWLLSVLFSDSANVTRGLKNVIDKYVTADVLAAVAKKYNKGYRLFAGTTNLDTTEFIIWDMGKIAASGRPDALDHYRNVLLASASIPVFFSPVYFEVEANGEKYYEMHVDGSAYASLCFRGFMLDLEDAITAAGLELGNRNARLFVIRNGRRDEESARDAVPGKALSIAEQTIKTLFKLASTSAMYRAYVLASRYEVDFKLADIPIDYEFDFDVTDFDLLGMRELFDFGYARALDGETAWSTAPPFIDPDEAFH